MIVHIFNDSLSSTRFYELSNPNCLRLLRQPIRGPALSSHCWIRRAIAQFGSLGGRYFLLGEACSRAHSLSPVVASTGVWQPKEMILNPIQIRVLGSLMEKEIATPENYPLSLNALVNACNQRSSRDPVLDLSEDEVLQALHTLEDMGLTSVVRSARVAKYEHCVRTVLNLRRDETALLCLLFLRGPQTPGELRARADRLYSFDGLDAVESTLARMTAVPDAAAGEDSSGVQETRPLAVMLARQPGSREARYAHLLGGPVESVVRESNSERLRLRDLAGIDQGREMNSATDARLSALEAEVASLRTAFEQLEARLNAASSTADNRNAETTLE